MSRVASPKINPAINPTISLGTLLEGWAPFDSNTNENQVAISGLGLDAGAIGPGDAYVAVAQPRGHGMARVAEAAARGAAVVLHDGGASAPRLDIQLRHPLEGDRRRL